MGKKFIVGKLIEEKEVIIQNHITMIKLGNLRIINLFNASSDSSGLILTLSDAPANRVFNTAIYDGGTVGRIDINTSGKMNLCDLSGSSLQNKKNIVGQIAYSVK